MKHLKHTLKELKKRETLSPQERALLRSKINEYREYTPLRNENLSTYTHLPHVAEASPFSFLKPMPLVAGLLIAVSVSGGTALAAEGTVPGDVLYPIKTAVIENVRGALAFDAEAKTEVDAWRAERRLDEAQKLAARAELSDDKRESLEIRFTEHAARVQDRIAMIEVTNPALAAELSAKFEASLEAHEAILAQTDDAATAPVQVAVRNTLNIRTGSSIAMAESADAGSGARIATFAMLEEDTAMQKTSVAAPAPTETAHDDTSAKRMYAAAQKSLRTTNELYAKVKAGLDVSTKARIETYLDVAASVFAEGERQYTNELYNDAFISFKSVLRATSQLSVYLKAQLRGDIDISRISLPPIENFPTLINLPYGAVDPVSPPFDTHSDDDRPNTDTEQIDPPSLELETGPEDTSDDAKEEDVRPTIEIRL